MHEHLLTIRDITGKDLERLFELSAKMKRERGKGADKPLAGKSVGMIFAKPSTRSRVSFEVGINELGGSPIYLDQGTIQLGRGETFADTSRVLSRYLHGVVIRTFEHRDVVEMAKNSSCPVINALTNEFHPCQALTDIFTIHEFGRPLKDTHMVFLGDGASNMANSLTLAAALSGMRLTIAAPPGFHPNFELIGIKPEKHPNIAVMVDPMAAVNDADFVYTDVWVSMGFEEEAKKRRQTFTPYQVNAELMAAAPDGARVLHCLPAHRGEEITDEVIDSRRSIVFEQAENRLHVQKALLAMLIK